MPKKPNATHFQFLFTQQAFPWNKEYMKVLPEVPSALFLSVQWTQVNSSQVRKSVIL